MRLPRRLGESRTIGGRPVLLRPVRPEDSALLRAALRRLSPESRYQRFHAHVSDLPPAAWQYLSRVDGHDHVAIVAIALPATLVGVARFIRLPKEPRAAEVAVTVVDEYQRKGIGTWLLDALSGGARERDIDELVAYALAENTAIRRLLERQGAVVTQDSSDGCAVERRVRIGRAALGFSCAG